MMVVVSVWGRGLCVEVCWYVVCCTAASNVLYGVYCGHMVAGYGRVWMGGLLNVTCGMACVLIMAVC